MIFVLPLDVTILDQINTTHFYIKLLKKSFMCRLYFYILKYFCFLVADGISDHSKPHMTIGSDLTTNEIKDSTRALLDESAFSMPNDILKYRSFSPR